ncbi:hypothetical protein K435DRAFT_782958 [Dendrothele bispora CBS 962.96]|uniref:Uncharacterized protein n=1 Tax=Dendrothele bispora (strain CBS 962.96) TaxID=1314807 RepID=A0A4S8LD07_DENBC|nr:hypothetical protein K435DRAFT_782958 [Dendrothele bispora CBS 962.96]
MPTHDPDVFSSEAQYLSASSSSSGPRRSPSRQTVNARRSNASLHGSSSLAHAMDDDAANGRFSLAHELAAALLPEPSAGSRLLAEEFGIEYDEGAEGIDEDDLIHRPAAPQVDDTTPSSLVDGLDKGPIDSSFHGSPERPSVHNPPDIDPVFGSPTPARQKKSKKPEQDAMEVLAQDLESTDNFLSHLRHIDSEPGASTSQQPNLEKMASDIIRRLNDTARDREGQLRELLEYEREFRKIAGEVGGNDVLGQLEELAQVIDISDETNPSEPPTSTGHRRLNSATEESSRIETQDWELDPNRHLDSDEEEEPGTTPVKDTFPPPPPIQGSPTPAKTIPQLTHFRTFTTSLVSSLTTISEHAQVNGAATADAGRKIRALKNKIGTWRAEWDSAERSRIKVERWEAGVLDGTDTPDETILASPPRPSGGQKRIDGRRFVQEHLEAFERALVDAGTKTQAIMASG